MDVAGFCRQSNVVAVVGKGGVGKTTVSAALAAVAARAGLDVLLISLDDSATTASLFGRDDPVVYDEVEIKPGNPKETGDLNNGAQEPVRVAGRIRARVLSADEALIEYLSSHGLGRVAKRLTRTGALDVVTTAIPGVREVLVLGKLKQLERNDVADLIVLDAPASGHAVTFLTSSRGLFDAARGGPLHHQAQQVIELLSDGRRCQVLLVTTPEETPVTETIETAYRLEEEVGITLGPVVVNACYPTLFAEVSEPWQVLEGDDGNTPFAPKDRERLEQAARFRRSRQQLQHRELDRLGRELPLDQLRLPNLFKTDLGPDELEMLVTALSQAIGRL